MSDSIKVELTPEARKIIDDLQTFPVWALQAVARAMDRANQMVLQHVQQDRLSGKGPFPVSEHKLGEVTSQMRQQAWAAKSTITGDTVQSAIGDSAKYAEIHELGGTIHIPARKGKVRLRTTASGSLQRQVGYAALAVFARQDGSRAHKRYVEKDFEAEAYDIQMPARAPFRTGAQERLAVYGRMVSNSVVLAWEAMK